MSIVNYLKRSGVLYTAGFYSLEDKITEYHKNDPNCKIQDWSIGTKTLVTKKLVYNKYD